MPVQDYIDEASRYSSVEIMVILTDEQGGGFGRASTPVTFRAATMTLGASETFQAFGEVTTIAYKLFADLPLNITEKNRLYHPSYGELNIRSVKPIPEEGMVVMEATAV